MAAPENPSAVTRCSHLAWAEQIQREVEMTSPLGSGGETEWSQAQLQPSTALYLLCFDPLIWERAEQKM